MVKLLHLKDTKLHNEISISLYKSPTHGEGMLFDHPLIIGLMQWNGTMETLIDLMRP